MKSRRLSIRPFAVSLGVAMLGIAGCDHKSAQPQLQNPTANVKANQPSIKLLENDPQWIALRNNTKDNESMLRAFSPEWNQTQAAIEKRVEGITDPNLKAQERYRVSAQLLPESVQERLTHEAWAEYSKQEREFLLEHTNDYRLIGGFYSDVTLSSPTPVAVGNMLSSNKRYWLRLTVRELDSFLSKFRALKQREISDVEASRAPYREIVVTTVGGDGKVDAQLRNHDREKAELGVLAEDLALASQVDMLHAEPFDHFVVRKTSAVYIVERKTGTILEEYPNAAFCEEDVHDSSELYFPSQWAASKCRLNDAGGR